MSDEYSPFYFLINYAIILYYNKDLKGYHMIATIYLLIFLAISMYTSDYIFYELKTEIRRWLGAIIGIVAHMWLPALFAFIFSFNNKAHILALVLWIIICMIIIFIRRKKKIKKISKTDLNNLLINSSWLLPIFITICVLLSGHVLFPGEAGVYSGQSTYGDTAMHLSMITSIAEQKTFPPNYSLLSGVQLSYPFLVNSQAATLYQQGLSLRWAVLVQSMLMAAIGLYGFFLLSREMTGSNAKGILSTFLFFICGGIGFIFFLNETGVENSVFSQIFTGFYVTPTNHQVLDLHWSNVICDMIIPQRTTMLGWTIAPACLYLINRGVRQGSRRDSLLGGILMGALPLMHTHTYLAIGLACIGWFVAGMITRQDRGKFFMRWVYFAIPAIGLALPQLIIWTFTQTDTEGFIRISMDWLNYGKDNWLWFWIKNVGITFIFIIPALYYNRKKYLNWYAGAFLIFLVAEIVVFQPNDYDNNKLFYIWYMFTAIITADWMIEVYKSLNKNKIMGRNLFAAIAIVLLFSSGVLTIGRELNSNAQYLVFSHSDLEAVEFIKENTEPDDLFITGMHHLNPVASLTGRNIYCGAPLYLFFHGLDYSQRERDLQDIYTDKQIAATLPKEIGADYIYISSWERGTYDIDNTYFDDMYEIFYASDDIKIYIVN